MRVSNAGVNRRGGAAAVEMAFCLLPLLLLIFGILEFGRFLMDRHLLDNATRAACRYVLANNTQTSVINELNLTTNPGPIQGIVSQLLAGRQNSDFTTAPTVANGLITVNGLHYDSGTQTWVAVSQSNIGTLAAGDRVWVTVNATFKFILVPFLPLQSTVPMKSQVTMLCEGGT